MMVLIDDDAGVAVHNETQDEGPGPRFPHEPVGEEAGHRKPALRPGRPACRVVERLDARRPPAACPSGRAQQRYTRSRGHRRSRWSRRPSVWIGDGVPIEPKASGASRSPPGGLTVVCGPTERTTSYPRHRMAEAVVGPASRRSEGKRATAAPSSGVKGCGWAKKGRSGPLTGEATVSNEAIGRR